MKGDSDNFESLRHLLALKRYEQAPPGYFQNFSGRVIARIEAGERGEGARGVRTWLQWLWALIEQRPVFAGAFGAAVCALLIAGMLNSEEATGNSGPVPFTPPLSSAASLTLDRNQRLASDTNPRLGADTNSVESWFNNQLPLIAEPAGAKVNLMGGQ